MKFRRLRKLLILGGMLTVLGGCNQVSIQYLEQEIDRREANCKKIRKEGDGVAPRVRAFQYSAKSAFDRGFTQGTVNRAEKAYQDKIRFAGCNRLEKDKAILNLRKEEAVAASVGSTEERRKLLSEFEALDVEKKENYCINEWATYKKTGIIDYYCASLFNGLNEDKRVAYCVRHLKSYGVEKINNLSGGDWLYDACLNPSTRRDEAVMAALTGKPVASVQAPSAKTYRRRADSDEYILEQRAINEIKNFKNWSGNGAAPQVIPALEALWRCQKYGDC